MRRLCVFSGSSPGGHPDYAQAAEELGRVLAGEGIGVVYGGAQVGFWMAPANLAHTVSGTVYGWGGAPTPTLYTAIAGTTW